MEQEKNYRIVNKIIIAENTVFLSAAWSRERPLNFVKAVDPDLTELFRQQGLQAMLRAVLRLVYHGDCRLRASSRITKALRESVHTLTLDQIHELEEDAVVAHLAVMTEQILLNPGYDPADDPLAVSRPGQRPEEEIYVSLLGQMEIRCGEARVVEELGSQPLAWGLLKYLLAEPRRSVTLEELLQQGIWPESEGEEVGAARVRLRRAREVLEPLGLGSRRGLISFSAGYYGVNPRYPLRLDTDTFLALAEEIESLPPADHRAIALGRQALEQFKGPFLAYSQDVAWTEEHRRYYHGRFTALARELVERSRALGSDELLPLLTRRAADIVPEEEQLHRHIISYLVQRKQELELTRYIAQLDRSGRANWLRDPE